MSSSDPAAIESGNSWNGIDAKGAPVIVTFSFPTTLSSYDQSIAGFTPQTVASFSAFTAAEQTQAMNALNQWAAASGIVFVEVAPGKGDITFANVSFSTTDPNTENGDFRTAGGIGFYPFGAWSYSSPVPPAQGAANAYGFTSDLTPAGAVFMNADDLTSTGETSLDTLLHEIGHAIGLKHPDQVVSDYDGTLHNQILDPSLDSSTLTIMSEIGDSGAGANATLFALDQSAAADLYGPAGTGSVVTGAASGSNTVSTWTWDPVAQTLTQSAVSANDTIHGTSVDDIIYGYDYGDANPTTGVINMFGLDGTNHLYAGSGTTNLYGGPDTNYLYGGAGNDNFYVFSAQTTVTDAYTTGNNTVYATGVSFTLPTNVDTLQLYGAGLTGTGNSQNDKIYGDGTYANTLIAGSGNDYMVGGAGGNTLVAGTGVDLMYGGAGANTFVFKPGDAAPGTNLTTIGDFKPGVDKIDLSADGGPGVNLTFSTAGSFSAGDAGRIIAIQDPYNAANTILEADFTGSGQADFAVELNNVSLANFQSSDLVLGANCFVRGARIATTRGDIPIEALNAGDLVLTADGAIRPVVWLGHRTIDCDRHPLPLDVWPIRVAPHAFGPDLPVREVWLSPGHNVALGGVLMPISALANGQTVRQVEMPTVEYWHVELDRHDIVLCEHLPAESYLDTGNRAAFANGGAFIDAFPDFKPKDWRETCLPLVQEGPEIVRMKEALIARLAALGVEVGRDADPHLLVDGVRHNPAAFDGTRMEFFIEAGAREIRLRSRTFVPAHTVASSGDGRTLGLCVQALFIDDVRLDLEDDGLAANGWNGFERDHAVEGQRWTTGDALIGRGARRIVVELAGHGYYWIDRHAADRAAADDRAAA